MERDERRRRTTGLRMEQYAIHGAELGPENPLAAYRDPAVDGRAFARDEVPAAKREGLGSECAFRVLPFRTQDGYTRARKPLALDAAVLENEFLRATFLPGLGGRLASLHDKAGGRELLSRNPVFQPANLAIRNAWFSGGVEWNLGRLGHACHTCSPLFAARVDGGADGEVLRFYDFERQTGLFWQMDFRLPPGSRLLYASVRVVNPRDRDSPLYWWTNIAVPEAADVRVLAPAKEALYLDTSCKEGHRFGLAALPRLPSLGGGDATYALESTFANEFFFQCEAEAAPWEAAVDSGGKGFFERSTRPLSYRKLFCWGSHAGGRHWQEFLAEPGVAYLEIQAGLAPTQFHGARIAARSSVSWTEAFGALELGPGRAAAAHGADWAAAVAACEAAMADTAGAGPKALAEAHARFAPAFDAPVAEILLAGTGWGALETARYAAASSGGAKAPAAPPDPEGMRAPLVPGIPAKAAPPAGLHFPASTLGPEQEPWLRLLSEGRLPEAEPGAGPGAFMVSSEWRALLERSLVPSGGAHWRSLYLAGVARLEALDEAGAEKAFRASLAARPNAWAKRDLAVIAARRGDAAPALESRREAWRLEAAEAAAAGREPCRAFAEELLEALLAAGLPEEAIVVLDSLPPALAERDRPRLHRVRAALALDRLEEAERLLDHDFATIREGETALTDAWFEIKARRLAAESGRTLDAALRAEAAKRFPPPGRIDFRMIGAE
ncbi:MAG: DUF5107 domain-containing protein [Spirochaetaceae bacterium]|nr:DUF5107 domain-containing protein [Spirochaetaceae bacterium]